MAKKRVSKSRGRAARPARAAKSAGSVGEPGGRVHLYVGISLDGYIAAPDGGVEWLNPYSGARAGYAPFIKSIGSAVMGRTTYDHAVSKFGARSAFGVPVYVVTHRPLETSVPRVVPFTGEMRDLVAQIRAQHPKDIWLMGGGLVTRSFIEADLIDIWSVAFVPTVLGAGLPMFPTGVLAEKRLKLACSHTYPNGVVELRYERK